MQTQTVSVDAYCRKYHPDPKVIKHKFSALFVIIHSIDQYEEKMEEKMQ